MEEEIYENADAAWTIGQNTSSVLGGGGKSSSSLHAWNSSKHRKGLVWYSGLAFTDVVFVGVGCWPVQALIHLR